MATILMMIGGAILSATAFTVGSYIEKKVTTPKNSNAERKRHDLALEKYTKDWQTYQKKKEAFEDWQYQQQEAKKEAAAGFQTTDENLKYYNSTHQELDFTDDEPTFSNYYQPGANQKNSELLYVTGGMIGVSYLVNKWL